MSDVMTTTLGEYQAKVDALQAEVEELKADDKRLRGHLAAERKLAKQTIKDLRAGVARLEQMINRANMLLQDGYVNAAMRALDPPTTGSDDELR